MPSSAPGGHCPTDRHSARSVSWRSIRGTESTSFSAPIPRYWCLIRMERWSTVGARVSCQMPTVYLSTAMISFCWLTVMHTRFWPVRPQARCASAWVKGIDRGSTSLSTTRLISPRHRTVITMSRMVTATRGCTVLRPTDRFAFPGANLETVQGSSPHHMRSGSTQPSGCWWQIERTTVSSCSI